MGFVMNKFYLFFILCFLIVPTFAGSREDKALEKKLIGAWEWEKTHEGCKENGFIAFKSNGTYTSTTANCLIDDDGFGMFQYGWYVVDGHICLAFDERQAEEIQPKRSELKEFLRQKKLEGYNKQDCIWKVSNYTAKTITVIYSWDNNGKVVEETFTLKKTRM